LQLAIGGSIGLFIAYIGLKNAGFLSYGSTLKGATPGAAVVPSLINFSDKGALVALAGLILIVALMLLKVKGAMLIGILAATVIAVVTGLVSLPPVSELFSFKLGGLKDVAFSFFGNPGFGSLFSDPGRIFPALMAVFAFSLTDTFDTVGTFIGTGKKSGIFDDKDEKALSEGSGFKSKMDKALFADSVATSIGALVGTSNATTYVESAAGIGVGGRTGFTSVITAVLFLLCLPFAALFGIVPSGASAPALIVVGILMAESFSGIKWGELEEAIPSFLTILIMAFAYSISYGIAAGFIFYCIAKIIKGKAKEVHPVIYVSTALFIVNFIVLAAGIV
jgi:AGZA family xanthine/uracil permease-like MFS transporter